MARTVASLGGGKNVYDPVNLIRFSTCTNRLTLHVNAAPKNDPVEFFNICFSLARAIDYSVSYNEIPPGARELPSLLKQVCRLKDASFLPAAILVLMISAKNACQRGWFSDQDSKELCRLTSELQSSFCTTMDFTTQPNSFQPTIATIMSRYYPRIKMGELIAFLEIKPGYGTYVHDFQIIKDFKCSKEERIRLLVAQTDNIETSSCLINPADTSFLLNGKGVDRRRINFMDTGPQIPTLLNHYLKYGTNLLQAVGQFNGNYIIVISFMKILPWPDHSTLKDYVQPTISMEDSDPEIIEGPSRISLNCPISFKRIKVPVKGHMCKHRQCIDYVNYMDMNLRRPSWRCPHCNQHLCFPDIRVDKNVVKVLKEVGKTVNAVTISSDGSWEPITEIDDKCDKPREDSKVSTEPVALNSSDIAPYDITDLTKDNYIYPKESCETAEQKLFSSSCQNHPIKQEIAVDSNIISNNEAHQSSTVQVEDNFLSRISLSTHESGWPNCHLEAKTSVLRNGYADDTIMCKYASGNPVSGQSLPVPSPTTSSLQQRQRDHPVIKSSSLVVPRTSAESRIGESAATVPNIIQGQQNFRRTNFNLLEKSRESSAKVKQYPVSLTVGLQDPSHEKTSYKVTPVSLSGNLNSSQQQTPNTRESINQSLRRQTYQGDSPDGIVNIKRAHELVASQRAASTTRVSPASKKQSPYPLNYDKHGTSTEGQRKSMLPPSQLQAKAVAAVGMATDSNTHPSVGRMRGSLTGRAYLDAYNHYMGLTQEPQATTQQARATTQPGPAAIDPDRAKSYPATQQARSTKQPTQAMHPDKSRTHASAQHAKAHAQAKATTQFEGAITQQAKTTSHLHGAINQPPLANSQQAQAVKRPVTATAQQDEVSPHQDIIITERAKATTEQAKATTATLRHAKSNPSDSIANLLSSSASSSLEVLKANRVALAQAGINPVSGSSSGLSPGWPSGKN